MKLIQSCKTAALIAFNVVGGGFVLQTALMPIYPLTFLQAAVLFIALIVVLADVGSGRLTSENFYTVARNRAYFVSVALVVTTGLYGFL